MEVKVLKVQGPPGLRIAGIYELKSPVAPKSVNQIGIGAATDSLRSFQDGDVVPVFGGQSCGTQSR